MKTYVKCDIEKKETVFEMAGQLAHTLHNLRFFTKYWNEHGGYAARERMKYWQDKADKLLDSYGITTHNNIKAIKK